MSLEDELDKLIQEKKAVKEQLTRLRERREMLRGELREIKEKLDVEANDLSLLRERVKELREEKFRLDERIRDLKSRLVELKRISRGLQLNLRYRDGSEVEKEINRLEWELQTKPKDEINEDRIVESLKRLALELESWKKAYRVKTEIESISKKINALGDEYLGVRSELESLLEKLAYKKDRVKQLVEAKKQVVSELKGVSNDITELQDLLIKIEARINAIKMKLAREEMDRRRRLEEEILSKKKKEAEKRLKRGEALSWEDLQALFS